MSGNDLFRVASSGLFDRKLEEHSDKKKDLVEGVNDLKINFEGILRGDNSAETHHVIHHNSVEHEVLFRHHHSNHKPNSTSKIPSDNYQEYHNHQNNNILSWQASTELCWLATIDEPMDRDDSHG